MSKLLTVVIPAYNMHDYLRHCLDSICVESIMSNVQVIIVNDGSIDDTSQIAHEYERRYPYYFQVIDKENGNYGSCMNVALKLAEGKYFRTLDADDWYDSESYALFVEKLSQTDADMILSEKVDHYQKLGRVELKAFDTSLKLEQTIPAADIDWHNNSLREMMGVMFITYRTSVLHAVGLRWVECVPFSDFQFCIQPLQAVSTVCLLPIPVYHYLLERDGQSVAIPWSPFVRNAFLTVVEAVVSDYNSWIDKATSAIRELVDLKMALLLPNLYCTLYLDGPFQDDRFQQIESAVKSNDRLRQITDRFDGYRGIHYVTAYRKSKCRSFFIYCDYKLRSCSLIQTLKRWHL